MWVLSGPVPDGIQNDRDLAAQAAFETERAEEHPEQHHSTEAHAHDPRPPDARNDFVIADDFGSAASFSATAAIQEPQVRDGLLLHTELLASGA